MTFSSEALLQSIGDGKWLDRINPPYKHQTLHGELLTSTKVSNPTAKKSFGFGVTATKNQRLPSKRFYLDNATFAANTIKVMKEWNDPNLSSLDRLLILQKQTVTAALIVAGDESDPYITIVTNPSITKIEIDDENLGAPFWSDILQEELAYKIGVPYNRPSHLAAAGTGWSTRTDTVTSREDLIDKIQPILLHPAKRFGSQQGAIHHVLLFPALVCPPVGFFWSTKTTFSEFVASIKALNGTAYRSFLTVLEVCRALIEPWFDTVNAAPKDFCFRMQSAQPLMNAMPSKDNPIPDGIEDESLLDPILELLDQLLWSYYEDRVLTDCESKESSTNSASQLHYLLRYGIKCFPESLTSVYGYRVPFLTYFVRPSKGWLMGVDHGALFSDERHQAQWIQSYQSVKVPVVDNGSFEPVIIQTKLDLAVRKERDDDDDDKITGPTVAATNDTPAETALVNKPSKVKESGDKAMVPAIIIRNVSPNDDLTNLSRCIVNGIRNLHGEEAEVVSCYFVGKRKGAANVFLEFKEIRHARIALHLDGMQVSSRLISVQLMKPGEESTAAAGTVAGIPEEKAVPDKPKRLNSHNDVYRRELCTRHASGHCWFGDKCDFAHGVLELRLHYQTKLHPERCLYIRNIVRNYPTDNLMHYIRKKYEQSMHSSPTFTAIHVRGTMGDALVEFQDSAQASVARQILDGISLVNLPLEVYPWKPAYQYAFVVYFKEDRYIPIDVGIPIDVIGRSQAPKSATSEGTAVASLKIEAQENDRKEEKLKQLLVRAKQEIKDLREGKRQQDEVVQLLGTSLHSMTLSLSTALSEIDSVMQQMVDLQQQVHTILPSQTNTSVSNSSSQPTDAIKTEIERLQQLLVSNSVSDQGSHSSLLSGLP
ncbi:unnamed protein product [Cylindrotheca closterium]|uniref:C3H1-type domain-containing protein n=1 Tax=Cylindrotheca closterium TaxID=2856 RepID=A0AAD2CNQ2_9STRA|nr:unnamed protein product [Cylindrotheca closterium]